MSERVQSLADCFSIHALCLLDISCPYLGSTNGIDTKICTNTIHLFMCCPRHMHSFPIWSVRPWIYQQTPSLCISCLERANTNYRRKKESINIFAPPRLCCPWYVTSWPINLGKYNILYMYGSKMSNIHKAGKCPSLACICPASVWPYLQII